LGTIVSFITSKYTSEASADLITSLPGSDGLDLTDMYSGYLVTNAAENTKIHYWLVESENTPETAPVLFWTNGGPGCSGLIGFMTEQGPFQPNEDGSLRINQYSWNQNANVIFIESPPHVGFSSSDNYVYGDWDTAHINYDAIQQFFIRFPELFANDFYISGESYGGHYIPTLAQTIVEANDAGENPVINFKGFALGNPFTDPVSNAIGTVETVYGHQVISQPLYESWQSACSNGLSETVQCAVQFDKVNQAFSNLNPYALDYPVCDSPILSKQRRKILEYNSHGKNGVGQIWDGYYACEDNYATAYLNRKDVQSAIHVDSTIWTECSDTLKYNYTDGHTPMEPIYNFLINGGYDLKLMVYSGDDDTVCATIGTQMWMWDLGYKVLSDWQPWYYNDAVYGNQTGGYIVKFDGITLTTVHGAGHEVPTYKPQAALELINNFLFNTL